MIKKILPILFIPLFLTGCFGGTEENGDGTTTETGKLLYETAEFSLAVPQDWEIIESGSFTTNVPSETVVAFRNNIKSEIFTANLNIIKVSLGQTVSSQDFAKSNLESIKNSLLDFQELGSQEIVNGYLLDFTGRKSAVEPSITFKQLYIVKGTTGYIATASYHSGEDETVVKYLDEMLNSFLLE